MSETSRRHKPRVSRTHLNGWKCEGLGVAGYGMSVAAAYASWEQRYIRARCEQHPPLLVFKDELLRPLVQVLLPMVVEHYDPDSVQPDLGVPFSTVPLA